MNSNEEKLHQLQPSTNKSKIYLKNKKNLGFILSMSSFGGISWALRGTTAWGGFDGALIPGFTWAFLILFFFKAQSRKNSLNNNKDNPNRDNLNNLNNSNYNQDNKANSIKQSIDRCLSSTSFIFWLVIGVGIGGMLGYGLFIGWAVNSLPFESDNYSLGSIVLLGYFLMFICGYLWFSVSVIFFDWSINLKPDGINLQLSSRKKTIIRVLLPLLFIFLHFFIIKFYPGWYYPFRDHPIYSDPSCLYCNRLTSTIDTFAIFFSWTIGVFLVSILEKNWRLIKGIVVYSSLFGLSFGLLLFWFYFDDFLWDISLPAWKMWELSSGFIFGLLLSILIIKNYSYYPQFQFLYQYSNLSNFSKKSKLIYFSWFSYIFILIYGLSFHIGRFLGFYDKNYNQYAFPISRIVILLIMIVILIFISMIKPKISNLINIYTKTTILYHQYLGMMLFLLIIASVTIFPYYFDILYVVVSIPGFLGLKMQLNSDLE